MTRGALPPPVAAVIELRGRSVPYTLRVGPRARRARLEINDEGLTVVVPRRYDRSQVTPLIETNAEWIFKHLDRFSATQPPSWPDRFRDGCLFTYRGEPATLHLVWLTDSAARSRLRFENGRLTVSLRPCDRENPGRVIEPWLRERAREAIVAELHDLDPRGRRRVNRIYIRDQRTRWGSCSSGRRNLSFSWRLILAPPPILRYVVAHELAHLTVPDHSPKFWATLGKLYGDYAEARQWLRDYGWRLRF